LRAYRISNKTLDKYPELWWKSSESLQGEEYYPVDADLSDQEELKALPGAGYYPREPNKLVGLSVCDAAQQQAQDSPTSIEFPDLREVSAVPELVDPGFSDSSQTVPIAVQQIIQFNLFQEKRLAAKREEQMRQWLQSGDPILMLEANQYFQLSLMSIE
jgi:hypothetical protein